MATKSFTTTMKFNKKNADELIRALSNENKPQKSDVKFNILRDNDSLKQMFSSRKEIKHV